MQTYNFDKIKMEIEEELSARKSVKTKENNKVDMIYNTNIENYIIKSKGKLDNIILSNSIFKNINVINVEFSNCIFENSIFSNNTFENVSFINCNFYNSKGSISIFNCETIFKNCRFKNCNMQKSIWEGIEFYNTIFDNTNLKDSILSNIVLDNIIIKDCDMRSLKMINIDVKLFEFEDNYLSKVDEYTFIDKMKVNNKDIDTLKKNYKFYRSLSYKFEANGILNNAGEYYYISKCIENKTLKGINKIKSTIFWLLCGYGERPTFALITSLEIILAFAIIYMITGLSAGGDIINYKQVFFQNNPFKDINSDFMDSLYFSIVTFTTVGYGDITPVGIVSVFLSGIEMLLGVTMVGIWTATLARKITR